MYAIGGGDCGQFFGFALREQEHRREGSGKIAPAVDGQGFDESVCPVLCTCWNS